MQAVGQILARIGQIVEALLDQGGADGLGGCDQVGLALDQGIRERFGGIVRRVGVQGSQLLLDRLRVDGLEVHQHEGASRDLEQYLAIAFVGHCDIVFDPVAELAQPVFLFGDVHDGVRLPLVSSAERLEAADRGEDSAPAEYHQGAQAEAEERAARARKQDYKPPEIDNEPEIAASALSKGVSSASVAKAATQTRGMDTGRTTIIGIIGAGQASRALIRLRSGKVVTVRLGDRIDGGTINSIGNGRLTYVKSGRTHELRMLDGR